MSNAARWVSGLILITVPTIVYGGYFLLTSLIDPKSGYMENPLRQNFFRAGHAHAGVIVILSLICQILADSATLPEPLRWFVRLAIPGGRNSALRRVLLFSVVTFGKPAWRSGLPDLHRRSNSGLRRPDSRHRIAARKDIRALIIRLRPVRLSRPVATPKAQQACRSLRPHPAPLAS